MFTLGELVIIEMAILEKVKGLDMSLQCGQEMMQIVGKCEIDIARIKTTTDKIPLIGPAIDLLVDKS